VLAAYTVGLVALLSGNEGSSENPRQQLSKLERRVSDAVKTARPFQTEESDVAQFRRPNVTDVRCEDKRCRVVYTVSVPGRGRVIFQQLEMVRLIFRDNPSVSRVVLRVVRVAPTGPEAIRKAEEETPEGFPLSETTCDRRRLERRVDWRTQEQAQAALGRSCTVRDFDQGGPRGGGRGADRQGPREDTGGAPGSAGN
jgi:hypothetical protein